MKFWKVISTLRPCTELYTRWLESHSQLDIIILVLWKDIQKHWERLRFVLRTSRVISKFLWSTKHICSPTVVYCFPTPPKHIKRFTTIVVNIIESLTKMYMFVYSYHKRACLPSFCERCPQHNPIWIRLSINLFTHDCKWLSNNFYRYL